LGFLANESAIALSPDEQNKSQLPSKASAELGAKACAGSILTPEK
jgi:hypothetical protein